MSMIDITLSTGQVIPAGGMLQIGKYTIPNEGVAGFSSESDYNKRWGFNLSRTIGELTVSKVEIDTFNSAVQNLTFPNENFLKTLTLVSGDFYWSGYKVNFDNHEVLRSLTHINDVLQYNGTPVLKLTNNLTSNSETSALTAQQGKVLKDLIDTVANVLVSDDLSLDTMQELVDFVKNNREDIDDLLQLNDISALQSTVNNHLSATNPHSITKNTVGLAMVNNTSDADKPISLATQNALDLKVDKASFQVVDGILEITI